MHLDNLKINGFKYKEIADMLGKDVKNIEKSLDEIDIFGSVNGGCRYYLRDYFPSSANRNYGC